MSGEEEERVSTPRGAASRLAAASAASIKQARHSDGQKTRPYRASVSASVETWKRSSVSLTIMGAAGKVSEAVVRPDPSTLAAAAAASPGGGRADVVATALVFGGVGTPTSVRLRVTGPVSEVHWQGGLTFTFSHGNERIVVVALPSGE